MLFRKILLISLLLIFSSSVFADDKMDLGLEVYNNKAQCGVCHALQAAGSVGNIGPNLDQLKPHKCLKLFMLLLMVLESCKLGKVF